MSIFGSMSKENRKPFPVALFFAGAIGAIIVFQTIIILLQKIWDFEFMKLTFLVRIAGLLLAIFAVVSIFKGTFKLESRKDIFILLMALLLALFLMFGLQYILPPEFYSSTGFFSVTDFYT